MFDKTQAGKFKANEEANVKNNLHLVDPTTPGSPLEDTGTIDTTGATAFSGIVYTGKDGVSKTIQFQKTQSPDAQKIPYTVLVSDGREALLSALKLAITQHEVDPIITIGGSGANFDVVHIGAGTLSAIVMDDANQALSRGAISGVSIELQDAAAIAALEEKESEDKGPELELTGGKKASKK